MKASEWAQIMRMWNKTNFLLETIAKRLSSPAIHYDIEFQPEMEIDLSAPDDRPAMVKGEVPEVEGADRDGEGGHVVDP